MKNFLNILRIAGAALLPQNAFKSPMRAAVWCATAICILWALAAVLGIVKANALETLCMTFWVSLTLIFTVLCEAATENLSREQTSSLKAARESLKARKVEESLLDQAGPQMSAVECSGAELKAGELLIVRAGEVIPADGEVIRGIAAVDESALTGESAPVIREPTEERSSVTAGTKVLSDWIVVRVKAIPGQSFLDRMISMVEGTKRQKTPTEISVEVILTMLTILFLALSIAVACLSASWGKVKGIPSAFGPVETIGLFLCLAPTTIGALLPIVGISGMLRLIKANIIAKSGAAVEAAGNISVMMLDKTGTITMGDRQAREFYPAPGVAEKTLAEEAQLASLADTTPEGRSIVVLAKDRFAIREGAYNSSNMRFVSFSAQTRMSGVDLPDKQLRKGAVSAIEQWLKNQRLPFPEEVRIQADKIASGGGTPLVLADNKNGTRGVIALRDVVKGGLRERFEKLRALKIETVMVTGDNALTAAAVAADAGVDRFIAEATPEKKLSMIRQLQAQGHTVAMSGDGTNDAPALAQADVALAMNSGTQPAKEAGNLIDLDSNPTKLIEVVHIGKQNLITIGALTTFSLANDIAKFFTVLPAMAATLFPVLKSFDLVGFHNPAEAMRVALIFNAIVIPLLMPLALMGSPKPQRADGLLLKHIFIYGLGGAIFPLILMKLIAFIA